VPIKVFLYLLTTKHDDKTAKQINGNGEQINEDDLNELELIEKYGNFLVSATYRLEFQIAVTARLAVFLSINYTGITLRIMERCGTLRW